MSWSEGRENKNNTLDIQKQIESLNSINQLLLKLYKDEDFHYELELDVVRVALNHWSGKNRLPTEKAVKLQENRDVIRVYQRIQMLQYASTNANVPSIVEFALKRQNKLSIEWISKNFGDNIFNSKDFPFNQYKDELAEFKKSIHLYDSKIRTTLPSTEKLMENKNSMLPSRYMILQLILAFISVILAIYIANRQLT